MKRAERQHEGGGEGRLLVSAVAVLVLAGGCGDGGHELAQAEDSKPMPHVINRKCDFTKVPEPLESNECTPTPEAGFQGILINAPEDVVFKGTGTLAETGTVVRLCGRCKFPYNMMGLNGTFYASILFVAVNDTTHKTFSGKFEPVLNPEPPPEGPPEDHPGLLVGEYFNPDLAEILALPAEEAEYVVYATLGTHKSNVLRVKLHRRAKS